MQARASLGCTVSAALCLLLFGCDSGGSSGNTCRDGGACANDAGDAGNSGTGGSSSKPPLKCGSGTVEQKGECVPADAGSMTSKPVPGAVGSACKTDDDCIEGTTCLADASLPGNYCTVVG